MAQDRRSARILAVLLPAGVLGLSVSLASADAAATLASDNASQVKNPDNVSGRLQSIRASVSDAFEKNAKDGEPFVAVDPETRLAWWGNGGWRNGGWRNGGWRNGGWGNGGWGNGGWHNWGNGWHNGLWLNI
jgi:rSAM-associated Gly-rich repeat protein